MWRSMSLAFGVAFVGVLAMAGDRGHSQGGVAYGPNEAPNPYKFTYGWAQLPDRRKWGAVVSIDIDRDGKSIWVFDRCEDARSCAKSKLDPIMKFDEKGKLV